MGRKTDPEGGPVRFRASRISCVNGSWFFSVRGGGLKGPFSSKAEAEGELVVYTRLKQQLESFGPEVSEADEAPALATEQGPADRKR